MIWVIVDGQKMEKISDTRLSKAEGLAKILEYAKEHKIGLDGIEIGEFHE